MNGKKRAQRTTLIVKARDGELASLLDDAMRHGSVWVDDATPASAIYHIIFWHYENAWNQTDERVCEVIDRLESEDLIFRVTNYHEYGTDSRLENIKEIIKRNRSVAFHIIFRVDAEDQEAVLAEIKKLLQVCIASNP